MMTQLFGDFREELPECWEYLTIVFSPSSAPLQQRWRNNGLSADFMADYLMTFFPNDDQGRHETSIKARVRSAVSFIANELLENAMKFNDESSQHPIRLTLQLHPDRLVFLVANSVHLEAVKPFQAFVQQLIEGDPGELYMQQLEKNAEDDSSSGSGLGLLTMLNDYQAKLGWKFEPIDQPPATTIVYTMVQLMT